MATWCRRAGLAQDKLDLSEVNDLVDGFVINNLSPARSSLEQLQKGFFFDCVESDGVLKFIPRGGQNEIEVNFDRSGNGFTEAAECELSGPRQRLFEWLHEFATLGDCQPE